MIFTLLALFGATVASYTDIKRGIIQNKLTFGLFAVGVVGHLIIEGRGIVRDLLASVLLIFIIGYAFWHVGGWSAGDAKEFLFIAALLPRYPQALEDLFTPSLGPYPFVITIFINTFLIIFPFILVWGIYISFKTGMERDFFAPAKRIKENGLNALVITTALLLTSLLNIRPIFVIPFILISYKLGNRIKAVVSVVIVFWHLISVGDLFPVIRYFMGIFVTIFIFRMFWNSITIVRTEALHETVKVEDIEEGMVLSEEIYTGEGKIENRARGLTMEEVDRIRELKDLGKIDHEIKVKKTAPFAPVILFGLLISLGVGDMMVVLNG